jgi:hypothetical protein
MHCVFSISCHDASGADSLAVINPAELSVLVNIMILM